MKSRIITNAKSQLTHTRPLARILFALAAVFLWLPTPTQAQNGVALYWPLASADATGTNVLDASGNNNTGSLLAPGAGGTMIAASGGLFGGPCLTIASGAGAGGVVELTNSPVPTYPFTVSLWCKSTKFQGVWAFGTGNANAEFFGLLGPLYGTDLEDTTNGGTGYEQSQWLNSEGGDGAWHQLCIAYIDDGDRDYYFDGELNHNGDPTGTVSGSFPGKVANFGTVDTLDIFSIGCRESGLGQDASVNAGGSFQDCIVWDSVVSDATIAAVYGLGYFQVSGASNLTAFLNAYSNQTSVNINGFPFIYTNGLSTTVGAVTGTLGAGTAAVTLDASGGGMQVAAAGGPPVISSFKAPQITAYVGDGPLTLNYNVTTNSLLTSIMPEIGILTNVYNGDGVGSVTVDPTATTTYTLTVSNVYKVVTAQVTITILPTPPAPQLILNWGLDESNGTTAYNFEGGNTNFVGQFVDPNDPVAPEWSTNGTPGITGGCLTFPNATNYSANGGSVCPYVAYKGAMSVVTNYPFTMSVWVLPNPFNQAYSTGGTAYYGVI